MTLSKILKRILMEIVQNSERILMEIVQNFEEILNKRYMQGRKRNRKLDFDYSSEAIYFVTICTQNRVHYFGKVESGIMNLSNFGKVAYEKCIWLEESISIF